MFAHGTAKPIGLETGTPFTQVPHPRERIEALRKGRLASDDGRVTLAMAILGPDWGAWEVVEHDIRMAREFGLVSSSHTRRREDCVVPDGYARMARAGLARARPQPGARHELRPADLRVVVDTGASLTSTVLVELHHHIGDTMVAAFREQGGLPSIGIDVELYTSGQMFREMQAALLFARGKEVRNNALRGNSPLKTIPVRSREALEWTTINGAKAFGLDGKIGTLSPGKKADIVMLRADDVNMAPVYDPIYSIVEIAGAGNVDTVIIDGVVRKQNGKLTIAADVLRQRTEELKAIRRAHHARGQLPRGDARRTETGETIIMTRQSRAARRSPDCPRMELCAGARAVGEARGHHHHRSRLHPGGNVDLTARLIAERLAAKLGQQVIVEPKPGAGGSTAAAQVARATPDGTTLFLAAGGHAVSAAIYNKLPYDALEGFFLDQHAVGLSVRVRHLSRSSGKEPRRVHRAWRRRTRASFCAPRRATAPASIWRSSCSPRPPASRSSTCRIAARRRPRPICSASASTRSWTT